MILKFHWNIKYLNIYQIVECCLDDGSVTMSLRKAHIQYLFIHCNFLPKTRVRVSVPQTKVDNPQGLQGNVWHQKYENKKKGFENHLKYSFNTLLKVRQVVCKKCIYYLFIFQL